VVGVLAALLLLRQRVHQVEHDLFAHRPQRAGAGVALQGALGDHPQRRVVNSSSLPSMRKNF
jgi:hypothetical protein